MPGEETGFSFSMYVSGHSERSEAALANLRILCERRLAGRYDLKVIDVRERPEMAERERIVATPVVIRTAPLPRLRVVGDLSDQSRVGFALGIEDPDALSERPAP